MFWNKKIIVLEVKTSMKEETIDELEAKLTKKFGYKVIVLPLSVSSNIQVIK